MSGGEGYVSIPKEISELAAEALSDHNDGWMKEGCRKRLREIRDYINRILKEEEK